MAAVDKYITPNFFKGKKLLEVGAGYANIGNLFHEKGSIVTSTEIRDDHIAVAKARYPHLNIIKLDGDNDPVSDKYDIILHWGLLYHLNNIEPHMNNICEMCDYLLLETEVCISNDLELVKVNEDGYDQAYHSIGSRPSEKYVEDLLKTNGFSYQLIKDHILNSSIHQYDWEISSLIGVIHKNHFNHGFRRYWICWRSEKESPLK